MSNSGYYGGSAVLGSYTKSVPDERLTPIHYNDCLRLNFSINLKIDSEKLWHIDGKCREVRQSLNIDTI